MLACAGIIGNSAFASPKHQLLRPFGLLGRKCTLKAHILTRLGVFGASFCGEDDVWAPGRSGRVRADLWSGALLFVLLAFSDFERQCR